MATSEILSVDVARGSSRWRIFVTEEGKLAAVPVRLKREGEAQWEPVGTPKILAVLDPDGLVR